jgi:hypothetical protein
MEGPGAAVYEARRGAPRSGGARRRFRIFERASEPAWEHKAQVRASPCARGLRGPMPTRHGGVSQQRPENRQPPREPSLGHAQEQRGRRRWPRDRKPRPEAPRGDQVRSRAAHRANTPHRGRRASNTCSPWVSDWPAPVGAVRCSGVSRERHPIGQELVVGVALKYKELQMVREVDWLPGWKFVDTTKPRRVLVYRTEDGFEISREPGEPLFTVCRKWQDDKQVWREETVEFPLHAIKWAVKFPPVVQQAKGGRR